MAHTYSESQKDCALLSDESILSLISNNYLEFCLQYRLGERAITHTINKGLKVSVFGDGIIVFEPDISAEDRRSCKSIILSCGVHGNETAPIEICNDLISHIFSGKVACKHRVMFLFGNIPSMVIAKRFVEENLNRLFGPDVRSESLEGQRAQVLMKHVSAFFNEAGKSRYHYDLHTAIRPSKNEKFAVYPFLHGQAHSKEQLVFLSRCEVNTILLSQSPTTTFSYYSSHYHQAHAFTVELGKVKAFGENDMSRFTAVKHNLTMLISMEDIPLTNFDECPIEIFTVNQVINKHYDDFSLNFSDDIANFTGFSKGTVFASEGLSSENQKHYFAQHEGEAVVFPNADVAIGQRALLTVIPHEL